MKEFSRRCARGACGKNLPHAGLDKFLGQDHQLFCCFAHAAAHKVEQKLRFPISHCMTHQVYLIGTSCTACNEEAHKTAGLKGGV